MDAGNICIRIIPSPFFLEKLRLDPSVISYNATMSSCEKADQWQLAVVLFEMMPLMRLQPDSISFSLASEKNQQTKNSSLLAIWGRNPL